MELKIINQEFQNSVAKAICSGVKEYLGLEKSNK
jgi:N-acetylmuramoyl-L-alanine amidase